MPKIQKVTDPQKIVTDPALLVVLKKKGIDKDYVEFFEDYNSAHPTAKIYRNLKSSELFTVLSGLPMVKPDGTKIQVGWLYSEDKYHSKANLFSAISEGKQVKLTCLSDQPDGTKKDEQVVYRPQLFIDGSEIVNGEQPTLLAIDPTNENYRENTLQWDYGNIAERRIRIIEGRYWDKFFILSHPHSKVSVKNNFAGKLKLRLGKAVDAKGKPLRVTVVGDEEIIEASEFDNKVFPVEIGASATYYPAVGAASPVDGWAADGTDTTSWATKVGHPGSGADDSDDACYMYIGTTGVQDTWDILYRAIILLDASPLSGKTVTAVDLSTYGFVKADGLSCTPDLNVYESAPASNDNLVAGDYNSLGTTPFATAITYASWNIGTPGTSNDWAFNAAGITFVQTAIDGDGIVKLGLRNANYDVAEALDPGNHTPPWVSATGSSLHSWSSDKGSGYKPKLVVTYTAAPNPPANMAGTMVDAGVI